MKVPQVSLTTDNLNSTTSMADIDIENVEIVVETQSTINYPVLLILPRRTRRAKK